MQIVTVAQMRDIERAADAAGLSYGEMMHNAGYAAAAEIRRRLGHWCAKIQDRPARILILAGPGNNGGDGLVCATALHVSSRQTPLTVRVYCLTRRAEGDSVYRAARDAGVPLFCAADDPDLAQLQELLAGADIIVDALLGTGVTRPIDGLLADILNQVKHTAKEQRSIVVALDGVTGMNYDTGALGPAALRADITVTFHAPKRGHYCYPAARANGELVVVPIGIEPQHLSRLAAPASDSVKVLDDETVRDLLPIRAADANKGSNGKVLVVGGCMDYSGAPTLVATAAYRVGAGLVTLAVPAAIQSIAAVLCREATFASIGGDAGSLNPAALGRIEQALRGLDARHGLIVGPGMGQDPATGEFLTGFLELVRALGIGGRLVVDADGLNHLARIPDWPTILPATSILTPHPGEMARLTGLTVQDVQSNRIGVALQYAQLWGHVVVLKGAFTVIAHPQKGAAVLPYSNPALAVAGTGDVLAGCIGGMLAQGLEPYEAAMCGAYVHACAGERWREMHGEIGLLAGDLLPVIPDVLHALRRPGMNEL